MQSSAARKMTAEGWLEPPPVPHHYDTEENHKHALRFGMWLFLGTEVLLFAGIFVGYFVFRTYFPEAVRAGGTPPQPLPGERRTPWCCSPRASPWRSRTTTPSTGRTGRRSGCSWCSVVMGGMFLCIKAIEYHEKFVRVRAAREVLPLHGDHRSRRSGLLRGLLLLHRAPRAPRHRGHEPADLGGGPLLEEGVLTPPTTHRWRTPGLYWHLVDLVWIFLYPLLYLV